MASTNTKTISTSGGTYDSGANIAQNWIETGSATSVGYNIYAIQDNTGSSSIKVLGSGDVIYIEGNFADFQYKQNGKTITLDNGGYTRSSITLSSMTNKVQVSTTLVFVDGSITLTNKAGSTKVSMNGLDDDGKAKSQALTTTYKDVVINANESNTDAATYFAAETPNTDYTLTTSADNLVGGSGNDLFSGEAGTFQSWDTVNGGTGTNTLSVELSSSSVAATLSNIQVFNAQDGVVGGSTNTLDFKGLSSLSTANLYGTGALSAYTLNNLGSLATVNLTSTGAANTLNFTAAALAATGQTLNITLNSVTGGVLTLSDTGSNALETVTLTSASSANTLGGLTTSGLGVTTLNIAGSQNLTLGAITDANATLTTVNASTATGNVSLTAIASSTVTGGTGDDTLTSGGGNLNSFTGGEGTNTFNFVAGLASTNTIVGGTGTDTLRATSAQLTAFTTAAPATNISGIESLTLNTALAGGALVLSAIQAGINDVNVGTIAAAAADTGTITFDSGVAGNIDVGTSALVSTLGNFTVVSAGTGIADSVYIDNDTAASDIFAGTVTATGVETLTLDGTTTTTAVQQGTGAISLTASLGGTTTLNLVGNNSFVPGAVITAGTINASGLTTNLDGVASFLTMTAGANTATTIIGGAGADTLLDNNAATTATSIDGGAGNDTITTTGVQNDTLLGGNGDDTITGATGNDSIDGGAGNDVVSVASGDITANDTISGGTGTADVLAYSTFVAVTDNVVAAQQQVSNFEVLSMAGAAAAAQAVTLTNYINNTGFTNINLGIQAAAANGYSFANASSILNTISVSAAAASVVIGTHVFDRLVDTATDALTIGNATTGTGAAQLMTAFTALDEETITLNEVAGTTAGANDLTISTLTVADLTTLNISSASDVIITNAIAGAANLATVNASTSTGAVTVDATNAGTAVTMTANSSSTAINTFTGGAFADVITGSAGDDVLVGNGGKDTISGGAGVDAITGGIGADNMTGGTGVDTFNQASLDVSVAASTTAFAGATVAAGDTLTFGNGVDVITDFTAGAAGDVINALVAGLPTTLIGETVADLTAGAETFFASGAYNASTGLFTITADGSGADTLIVQANTATAASDSLLTNSSYIVLVGVDSDNLVAGNIL